MILWNFGKIFHLKRWQLLHLLYQQLFLSLKKVDWKKQMGLKSAKSFNKSRLKIEKWEFQFIFPFVKVPFLFQRKYSRRTSR
jgi:hypothetical protein